MSSWFRWLLGGSFWAATGVSTVFLIVWQAFIVGVNHGSAAFLLICIGGVLSLLALVAAHELGHLIAGWAVGFPSLRLVLGPISIGRDSGRLRVRLDTDRSRPVFCVTHGPAKGRALRARRAAFILGGPAVNLAIGIGSVVAAVYHNPGPPASVRRGPDDWRDVAIVYPGDSATALLNIVGLVSLGLGADTLIPGRPAGFRTDGGQLLDLARRRLSAVPWDGSSLHQARVAGRDIRDVLHGGPEWDAAARHLIERIPKEAAALGDDFLGTSHLLLAAVAALPPDGPKIAGLDYASVRAVVEAAAEPRQLSITPATLCPTPRLELTIEWAKQRARVWARPVGCRDLWHGMLYHPESECVQILDRLGLRAEELRSLLT